MTGIEYFFTGRKKVIRKIKLLNSHERQLTCHYSQKTK